MTQQQTDENEENVCWTTMNCWEVIKRSWTRLKNEFDRLLTSACLFVGDWFCWISVESFFAVIAMSSGGIMSTIHTNSTRNTARKLVQLQIKTTASGMSIAVARCKEMKEKEEI